MLQTDLNRYFIYEIKRVDFQATGRPTRTHVGYITPIVSDPVMMTYELNRPGTAEITVNDTATDRLVRSHISRFRAAEPSPHPVGLLELVVWSRGKTAGNPRTVFWAGPLTSMQRVDRETVKLFFQSDLYYLHRLGIHNVISSTTAIDQFQLCRQIVAQGLAGHNNPQIGSPGDDFYLPAGELTKYWDPGLTLSDDNAAARFGRGVLPANMGENEISPRQGRSVLEWLQFLGERDKDWRFSFKTTRNNDADGFVLHIGRGGSVADPVPAGATRHADIGVDRSDRFSLRDDNLTDTVDLATSYTVEDWCNVVYVTGSGSGSTDLGEDGRVFYYAAPGAGRDDFADTRRILGSVYCAVSQPGLTIGGLDANGVPDGSDPSSEEYAASVSNFADSFASARNEPLTIPAGYRLRVSPDDQRFINLMFDSGSLRPGDTMSLSETASFDDVGRVHKAMVNKMEYMVSGGVVSVGVEFA